MKPTKSRLIGVACAVLLGGGFQPASATPTVVSTVPSWNGSSGIGEFGASGYSAWGQTVTAPTGTNRLLDFTFYLSDAIQGTRTIDGDPITPVPVEFQAHIVQFDMATRTLIGSVLYSSDPVTVPLTSEFEFNPYTFSADITVEAGSAYLLFLFANNYELAIPDDSRLRLAYAGRNVYGGGSWAIHQPADGDFNSLFSGGWSGGPGLGDDLAFSATFDKVVVAEPGTLAILGLGLAALGVNRRRTARLRSR